MFGYILPDKPNLYMKDYGLYRAFYCGLCHETGHCQGQCMRFGVGYDITFLSILFHGVKHEELHFKRKACVAKPFVKTTIVVDSPLQVQCCHLNALLLDFKAKDDLADSKHKGGKRLIRGAIRRQVNKARKALPQVAAILDEAFVDQQKVERVHPANWLVAADPFACCMQEIALAMAPQGGEPLAEVAYGLGQFVYLMDALDDYDKDVAKGEYNPLYLAYQADNKRALLAANEAELRTQIDELIARIKEAYRQVAIFDTEGIVTNTLWYGLRARSEQLLDKECKKCQKTHTKF